MNAAAAAAGAGGAVGAAGAAGAVATAATAATDATDAPALDLFDLMKSYEANVRIYLRDLFELVEKTVNEYMGKPNYDKYREHFEHIFKDRTVSLMSLNIKGLQSAILFKIIEDQESGQKPVALEVVPELLVYLGVGIPGSTWDRYEYIMEMKDEYPLLTMLFDPTNNFIVSLDGELSLQLLNLSYAQDVYLLGLSPKNIFADGQLLDPVSFFMHDLGHYLLRKKILGTTEISRMNVHHFLHMLKFTEVDNTHRYACNLWIFLLTHEFLFKGQELILSTPLDINTLLGSLKTDEGTSLLEEFAHKCLHRFYKSVLPKTLDITGATEAEQLSKIKTYLQWSYNVFTSYWNRSFTEKRARLPPGAYAERRTKKRSRKQKRRQSRKTRRSLS